MSSVFTSAAEDPSTIRIADPSYASQLVILRSVPVVRSCDSSGWYSTALKNVEAKRELLRAKRRMSQMMQDPSLDADTNSMSLPRTLMQLTVALCSFILPSITLLSAVTLQTLTDPSNPPLTIFSGSFAHAIDVTPPTCASLITYSSLPDWGPNARILPSLHPLMIAFPSRANAMQLQSRFGIWIRRSSAQVRAFHTRMSFLDDVAKSSL
mmetsp:Transcript_11581/g.22880  ORF Transcript_11581/g.22880 Transcript_11581/m.22880 type:complete len:210 (-) Transcript_11581:1073-1702(-)